MASKPPHELSFRALWDGAGVLPASTLAQGPNSGPCDQTHVRPVVLAGKEQCTTTLGGTLSHTIPGHTRPAPFVTTRHGPISHIRASSTQVRPEHTQALTAPVTTVNKRTLHYQKRLLLVQQYSKSLSDQCIRLPICTRMVANWP
jgi:hypothetical protein